MFRYLSIFLILQTGLFIAEMTQSIQSAMIIPFTENIAHFCAWLIKLFDESAVSQGIVLRSLENGFAVAIEAGCNGVEASLILTAAMLAFPTSWIFKLFGILAGFLAVQVFNIARIISLFYLGQWNLEVFEWAHLYVWQALIMLDVLIVFLLWLRYLSRHNIKEGSNHATEPG
ncbi:MAG: exosortase H [Methylococcaceae bacterium]